MYDQLVMNLQDLSNWSDIAWREYAESGKQLIKQAADAIEELRRKHTEERSAAVELTGELATVAAKLPRWIPVEEQLPENGYYVLAYEDGDIMMASYEGGKWVLRDMYEIIDDLKPTHWMPLPEPPKEDKP